MARSDGVEFDTHELARLAVDMTHAGALSAAAVRAVVQKGSLNIKNRMIADAQSALGSGSARLFPQSITYETRELAYAAEGIIGPDKDRPQGPLGNLLYFGSSKNAPVLNLLGPLEAEEPSFVKYLTEAAEKALDV